AHRALRRGSRSCEQDPTEDRPSSARARRRLGRLGADVEKCPSCGARMKLVALVQDPKSVARFLQGLGEPHEPPVRAPARAPPYYKTRLIRRLTAGGIAAA